jgi:hypothetical protein
VEIFVVPVVQNVSPEANEIPSTGGLFTVEVENLLAPGYCKIDGKVVKALRLEFFYYLSTLIALDSYFFQLFCQWKCGHHYVPSISH